MGFFDDLREDPRRPLASILEFLGTDAGDESLPADIEGRRNPGRGETIPTRFEVLLARVLLDEVRALHEAGATPSPHCGPFLSRLGPAT